LNKHGPTKGRGFANMDPERRREVAAKGGAHAGANKRSFSKNPELAAAAGRKGGLAAAAKKQTLSADAALALAASHKAGR
jgi:general stress protein YciG